LRLASGRVAADQEETRGVRRQSGEQTCRWVESEELSELSFDYPAHHRYDHQNEKGTASIRPDVRLCFEAPIR
jgi:hypothetical protein